MSIAQDYTTTTVDVTDFDVNNAMTDMEDLKNNLDNVIQELYALDAKER
jgi:hypothetical protein